MPKISFETVVGAVVVAVALGFLAFAFQNTNSGSVGRGMHLTAQFNNVEGISVGTDVRIAGVKVGSVIHQELDPKSYQARLDLIVQPGIELSDDTAAKITSEGLLGAKFVSLEPGGSETKLADGGELSYTQGAVDLWSLISQAMFSKNGDKPADGAAPAPDAAAAPAPAVPEQPAP